MVFANVAAEQRAAFVVGAGQNGVAANAHPRTARRFFRQILSLNFCVHPES
jgi:hypothetical protein